MHLSSVSLIIFAKDGLAGASRVGLFHRGTTKHGGANITIAF